MHVALYHPSIPPNTGNIGRLCVGMGCELHIIGPCPFDFSDKSLRRAGLDYWPHLTWTLYENEDEFLAWMNDRKPWLVSKFGDQCYTDPTYTDDDIIILGNEVTGIPDAWHQRWPDRVINIPIRGNVRSYNLGNAAAIVVSHALFVGQK